MCQQKILSINYFWCQTPSSQLAIHHHFSITFWPWHPILDTRISSVRPSSFSVTLVLPPPEIWNVLDWRALVKLRPPNFGKLGEYHFFFGKKNTFWKISDFLRFFQIFPDFQISDFRFSGLGWTGELWSNRIFLILYWTRGFPSSSSSSVLCHAQGTPPGFWNGLDWRALVESRPPNIGKLRG